MTYYDTLQMTEATMPKLLPLDVDRRLNELVVEGIPPPQILNTLVDEGYEGNPDIRTIQRRVEKFNKSHHVMHHQNKLGVFRYDLID